MDGRAPEGRVRVGVRDVGSRVVLRYRLTPQEHGPYGESLTDVVGELLAWTDGPDGHAVVRRRSGDEVTVGLDRLVTGKVVPATARPARDRRPPAG
ncbi:putative acetyltransferase [Solihabitans fulvus]|uniref:putative acetyltransferase n=1 Tax=Solihabitans fulvus TaxID=1892852 RepID=UPI00122E6BB6|nr:hypothetical protein [Solihabitans fulvus]